MFGKMMLPGIYHCIKPPNLHGIVPSGQALFVKLAAAMQGLRHCRQDIK